MNSTVEAARLHFWVAPDTSLSEAGPHALRNSTPTQRNAYKNQCREHRPNSTPRTERKHFNARQNSGATQTQRNLNTP